MKLTYICEGERWHLTNLSWSLADLGRDTDLVRQDVIQELSRALQVETCALVNRAF